MINLLKNIFLGEPNTLKTIKLGKPSFDDITAVTFGCYPTIKDESYEDSALTSAESESDSYNELSLDSYDSDSSDVEYDENIYTTLNYPQFRSFDNKLNLALELKRHLIAFRDEKFNKKWNLYYALQTIEEIGLYPSGMPFSKTELLEYIKKYEYSLRKEGYPISQYHNLFAITSSAKFELLAKTEYQFGLEYLEEQDENGETLLHHAVRWQNFKLIQNLLYYGFNINEPDFQGKTPIFCTTCHKTLDITKYLLSQGATPYVKTSDGKTLLDKAINKGNLFLAKFLIDEYKFDLGNRRVVKELISLNSNRIEK